MQRGYRILILLFFMTSMLGKAQRDITLSLVPVPDQLLLEQHLPPSFILGALTYATDVTWDEREFYYLMGLAPGQRTTVEDLYHGFAAIAKKQKFTQARICITKRKKGNHPSITDSPSTTDSSSTADNPLTRAQLSIQGDVAAPGNTPIIDLHIQLVSAWTLKKIHIAGIATGSDEYRQLYRSEPGDIFDATKHHDSLKAILDRLHEQGYWRAQVVDSFTYDQHIKTVVVTLALKRGRQYMISDVTVTYTGDGQVVPGVEKIQHNFVQALRHKPYSLRLLNRQGALLKKKLAEQEGYLQQRIVLTPTVKDKTNTVDLVCTIELSTPKRFSFEGNSVITSESLLREIHAFGSSVSMIPSTLFAQELQKRYYEKGFLAATVIPKEEGGQTIFSIQEGDQAYVADVIIHGAGYVSAQELKQKFFPFLKNQMFLYDADKVHQALNSLIQFYQREGFWDITVVDQTLKHREGNEEGNEYKFIVLLQEGQQRIVRTITMPDAGKLEQKMGVHNLPRPFDYQELARQRRILADHFREQGFLYVELQPQLTEVIQNNTHGDHHDTRVYDVTWHVIKQQERVRFGKTILEGLNKVPFSLIEREFVYKQGDVWDKEKLEQTLLQIRDLDLFSTIHAYPEHIEQQEPYKIIKMRLIEDDPYEIRVRAGVLGVSKNLTWREGATYKVGGTFLCRNVFNGGGQLRFDGDVTRFERYLSLSYRHPWLFGLPYRTIIKGYSNKYIQPIRVGRKEPLYQAVQQGGVVGVSRKWRTLTLGINAGLEWMRTTLKNRKAAESINYEPTLNDVQVPFFYVEPTCVLDRLDDKLNPHYGSFIVASLKAMFPLTTTRAYFKVLVEQSFFYPLVDSVIGAIRIRCGHVFNRCFKEIMPPDRFYLGGPNSVRGYETDQVPPLGCFTDEATGTNQVVPQGGRSMINMNAEIRFPLYDNFMGAVFTDAGVLVGDTFAAAFKERFVGSSGFGIRYLTPIGPLRLDIGFAWKKLMPHDPQVRWSLALGQAF